MAHDVLEGEGRHIRFEFKKGVKKQSESDDVALLSPNMLAANNSACLRLIWRTEKAVYAANVCNKREKPTYRIPLSTFVFMKIFQETNTSDSGHRNENSLETEKLGGET